MMAIYIDLDLNSSLGLTPISILFTLNDSVFLDSMVLSLLN